MAVTESRPEPFISLRTDRRDGGWSEVGVFVDPVISGADRILVAVVSHNCSKAKWIVHPNEGGSVVFKTRAEAMKRALWWARRTDAYSTHLWWERRSDAYSVKSDSESR